MQYAGARRASAAVVRLKRLLWVFAAIATALWIIGLFGHAKHTLFPPGPNFEDVLVYKGRFTLYHTRRFFLLTRGFSSFAYPAGAAPIYEALYTTSDAVRTYLLCALGITAAALLSAWIFLRRHGLGGLFWPLLLLTYPIVFLIQRANIELFLWLIVVLGLIAFRRGWSVPAAMLFGLAAAVKLYPIFLLGLFLKRREQLPALFTGLISAVIAMFAAVLYAGPTFLFAAQGFFTGVDRFQHRYVAAVSSVEFAFDHCLFSPAKVYAYTHHISPGGWTTTYLLLAGTFALLLFLRVRTLPPLNRIVFLVTAMVSLPPVSFTYTLVHLCLPLLLVLAALATQRTTATVSLSLALLLFLMLPLNALSNFVPLPTGTIQAAALLLLLLLASTQPWSDATLADPL